MQRLPVHEKKSTNPTCSAQDALGRVTEGGRALDWRVSKKWPGNTPAGADKGCCRLWLSRDPDIFQSELESWTKKVLDSLVRFGDHAKFTCNCG
jgi:hypothetical protein